MIGATGLVGRELLKALITESTVEEIFVITRRPIKENSDKVNEIVCKDFGNLPRNIKADHFISCLGTTIKSAGSKAEFERVDCDYVVDFAKIAFENNSKSFHVVSAAMAKSTSTVFYNKVKGQMEEEIEKLGLLSFYSYRPSLLIGNREVKRSGEQFAINIFSKLEDKLPKALSKHLGTRVSTIVDKIIEDIGESNPGRHIISF